MADDVVMEDPEMAHAAPEMADHVQEEAEALQEDEEERLARGVDRKDIDNDDPDFDAHVMSVAGDLDVNLDPDWRLGRKSYSKNLTAYRNFAFFLTAYSPNPLYGLRPCTSTEVPSVNAPRHHGLQGHGHRRKSLGNPVQPATV